MIRASAVENSIAGTLNGVGSRDDFHKPSKFGHNINLIVTYGGRMPVS